MKLRGWLLLAVAVWGLRGVARAQSSSTELPEELRIAPDMSPMPSMEVVTVRKTDGKPLHGLLVTTMKSYLLAGYGIPESRLVGAPSWLGSQPWVVNGKPSDELRDAEKTMTREQQTQVSQMLRRSMLRDLFKLKTHVETRKMEYFELVPAKGGIKIKEVHAFVPPPPGTPPPPSSPNGPMPPGTLRLQMKDGIPLLNARATTMKVLINIMKSGRDVAGRPIVDKTGFTGSFDLVDMQWSGMLSGMSGATPPPGDMDAPSMYSVLQDTFGLKLVATKGPVEVLVIDSIEEPAEN